MLGASEVPKRSWLKCGVERNSRKTGQVPSREGACGGVWSRVSSPGAPSLAAVVTSWESKLSHFK